MFRSNLVETGLKGILFSYSGLADKLNVSSRCVLLMGGILVGKARFLSMDGRILRWFRCVTHCFRPVHKHFSLQILILTLPLIYRTLWIIYLTLPLIYLTLWIIYLTLPLIYRTLLIIYLTLPLIYRTLSIIYLTLPLIYQTLWIIYRMLSIIYSRFMNSQALCAAQLSLVQQVIENHIWKANPNEFWRSNSVIHGARPRRPRGRGLGA